MRGRTDIMVGCERVDVRKRSDERWFVCEATICEREEVGSSVTARIGFRENAKDFTEVSRVPVVHF